MSEREPRHEDRDPFWQEDIPIGEAMVYGNPYAVRLRLHHAFENYSGRGSESLFVPQERRGQREYLMGRFYILIPDIRVTVALYEQETPEGAIGAVTGSQWQGMRHQEIGSMQAWYYPNEDRTAVLWEIVLHEYLRTTEKPVEDETLSGVWRGVEEHLQARWQPKRILVPSWEPMYHNSDWQAFLRQLGYHPHSQKAYAKDAPGP